MYTKPGDWTRRQRPCANGLKTTTDLLGAHSIVTDTIALLANQSKKNVANSLFDVMQSGWQSTLKKGSVRAASVAVGVGYVASAVRGYCFLNGN